MKTTKTSPRAEQIASHGVNASRCPFASFVFGRGWRGHKTAEAARSAADRDANRVMRIYGGGRPQAIVAVSATGELV